MNEIAFASFLLDTLLHEVFHSKRRMARELDVTLRTLQLNMKAGESAKGANRATLWAVCYCCEHRIDIQEIYDRFVATKKGGLFRTIDWRCQKAKMSQQMFLLFFMSEYPACFAIPSFCMTDV